jgi:hypothetical protein
MVLFQVGVLVCNLLLFSKIPGFLGDMSKVSLGALKFPIIVREATSPFPRFAERWLTTPVFVA